MSMSTTTPRRAHTMQGLTRYISTTAPAAAAAADTAPDDMGAELDGLVLCGEKGALGRITC